MKPKKIALFGGSFNPIHNHHIKMANSVLEKRLTDEVWIIPSKNHPYNKNLAPAYHRINMIVLAFNDPRIKINNIEVDSNETNYTIRTIQKLKEQYPYKFYWMAGSDILSELNGWYGKDKLLKETEFIIFKRKGYQISALEDIKIKRILNVDSNNESSTEIRERIRQNKPLKNLVPLIIEEYIKKEGLYKNEFR